MDNNVLTVSHSTGLTTPSKGIEIACSSPTDVHAQTYNQATEEGLEATVPANVRLLIRGLIERYGLSREQFLSIYEEYDRMTRVDITPGRERERREEEVEEPMNTGGDTEEEDRGLAEGGGGGDSETEEQQLQGENLKQIGRGGRSKMADVMCHAVVIDCVSCPAFQPLPVWLCCSCIY